MFDEILVSRLMKKFDEFPDKTTETDRMALMGIYSTQILSDLYTKSNAHSLKTDELIELDKLIIE